MQVVDFPELAPSVCVVCEGAVEGTPMVDTVRNLEVGGWPMNGRKYLCLICVRDAAHALGVFDVEREHLQGQIDAAAQHNAALNARIADLETIEAAVARLHANPKEEKPKPEPKKAPKPKAEPKPEPKVEEAPASEPTQTTYPVDGDVS